MDVMETVGNMVWRVSGQHLNFNREAKLSGVNGVKGRVHILP